jgi:hypothetical protein
MKKERKRTKRRGGTKIFLYHWNPVHILSRLDLVFLSFLSHLLLSTAGGLGESVTIEIRHKGANRAIHFNECG